MSERLHDHPYCSDCRHAEDRIAQLKRERDEARKALNLCVDWFDSKPVQNTWNTMATLSAAGHYLAVHVEPSFGEWAKGVWAQARALSQQLKTPSSGDSADDA